MEYPKHKVFISYYHYEDQGYKDELERILGSEYAISRSVQIGDIDPNLDADHTRQLIRDNYLRDSTVTIVLIGKHTWKRKHVDWEIYSSMRESKYNHRSGVIGILLPTRDDYGVGKSVDRYTIPPRLVDNLDNGFVNIYDWHRDPAFYMKIIHEAFDKRNTVNPNLRRPMFSRNRSEDDTRWY